jgi:hypothetical protein
MIRKLMASEELLRAAGTVTTKLAKWLGVRGYLDESAVETRSSEEPQRRATSRTLRSSRACYTSRPGIQDRHPGAR